MATPRSDPGLTSGRVHPELALSVAPPQRQGLVVLGMHRSGTSALTRVLSLLGADLPGRLLDPRPDAVRGYWESADLVAIHDRLLEAAGLAWHEVTPFPESWWLTAAADNFRREILEFLRRDFGASTL